jgi:ParB family chromosome partitioning protein
VSANNFLAHPKRKQQFEREQAEHEVDRNRRAELLKAREATFNRILESAPPMFTALQLRVLLSALCNLDPYTLTDDIAEHFAGDDETTQRTAEEILSSALAKAPDARLTSFALRLALTGHVDIPRDSEFDFLAEAEAAFAPPQSKNGKKSKKPPTPANKSKKTATKKVAA